MSRAEYIARPVETGTDAKAATVDALLEGVLAGDRLSLAKAISLVEEGSELGRELSARLFSHAGRAYTIGITGAPGSGKSTLTNQLIGVIRGKGLSVGVVAVDPTSPFTGGAILGDRIRMQHHSTDPGVFIRSMATRGHLGGLALAVPEALRVLDASGKEFVIVETVGVGQVEVEVVEAVDTTVVVLNPGWGDSIQVAKAGLLEVADVFVVNKADRPGADKSVQDLRQMLDFAPSEEWERPIVKTTATEGAGIDEVFDAIVRHRGYLERSGKLEEQRRARMLAELRRTVREALAKRAEAAMTGPAYQEVVAKVLARELDPQTAAERLIEYAGLS